MSNANPQTADKNPASVIPSITELLKTDDARNWLQAYPAALVTQSLRESAAAVRQEVLTSGTQPPPSRPALAELILNQARSRLQNQTNPRIRRALNGTGIILHTGLGRAPLPESVVQSIHGELSGYCTLAVDVTTGERAERDELVEYILSELTGAEAATVVNNNAAATMLVLAALLAEREVIVSRGQLIEIGGSFRLPEVMTQSRARLVEVGATNRTHLKDYRNALRPDTGGIMRVHPSNFRVVGFTHEVPLSDLAALAHAHNLLLIDDLGAGALVSLEDFGLPHEPLVRESVAAGADVVLFSGDKLIGGSQAGIIVGRKDLIQKIRRHPLMRAMRADKTCLMLLERTLHLFRDPASLAKTVPAYQMLSVPVAVLRERAARLVSLIREQNESIRAETADSVAYLGSGSLPTQAIPSVMITLSVPGMNAEDLARRLRTDAACVFGRIERERVCLDLRTLFEQDLPEIAAALGRVATGVKAP